MTDQPSDADAKPEFPRDAKPWLDMLADAEKRDRPYHEACDKIDRLFACIDRAKDSTHDRELQVFWANLEVLGPTIYSREPKPVVGERFRDRKPLPRRAAEILERALIADAELDNLHGELLQVRNDLSRLARGAVRVSLVDDEAGLRVQSDHIFRRDFRHGAGRKWKEVPWVGWRGYYTRDGYRERFGDAPQGVEFKDHRKERESDDEKAFEDRKAAVWEIWHRAKRKVVWVAEGAKEISDARDPIYQLDEFWPLAAPAYGTLKPESLTPIPDVVYYQDQLDEINELTDRIAKLADGLKLKGFYNAGQELGGAIETALADEGNRTILVPVKANLGPNASMRDAIQWMPIEIVAQTISQCIELRKQLMQDVYEITGLSDIMRGATEAQETLGAQQLKAQFGSVRVKERQGEMQRVARDVFRLKAEIMAEQMPIADLLALAQVDDLPTQADIQKQLEPLQLQAQQIAQQAETAMQQAMAAGDDAAGQQAQQQAQEAMGPLQQQMQQLQAQITAEAVEALLRDQRMRPFALEVETDSTIEPDQMAEKQNRVEFMGALGPLLQQGVAAMQSAPQLGAFVAESIRFVASGFKVPRSMDDALDELAEGFANYQPPQEQQPAGEDPAAAQAKAQAEVMKAQAAGQLAGAKAQEAEAKVGLMQQEMQIKQAEAATRERETAAKIELIGAQVEKVAAEVGLAQRKAALDAQQSLAEDARAERAFERDGASAEAEGARADRQLDMAQKRNEAEIKARSQKPAAPK